MGFLPDWKNFSISDPNRVIITNLNLTLLIVVEPLPWNLQNKTIEIYFEKGSKTEVKTIGIQGEKGKGQDWSWSMINNIPWSPNLRVQVLKGSQPNFVSSNIPLNFNFDMHTLEFPPNQGVCYFASDSTGQPEIRDARVDSFKTCDWSFHPSVLWLVDSQAQTSHLMILTYVHEDMHLHKKGTICMWLDFDNIFCIIRKYLLHWF